MFNKKNYIFNENCQLQESPLLFNFLKICKYQDDDLI